MESYANKQMEDLMIKLEQSNAPIGIWKKISKNIQEIIIETILINHNISDNEKLRIWKTVSSEIQEKKIESIMRNKEIKYDLKEKIWKNTIGYVKELKASNIIEDKNIDTYLKQRIWIYSEERIQEQKGLIVKLVENLDILSELPLAWILTNSNKVRINNLLDIGKAAVKNNKKKEIEEFIEKHVGVEIKFNDYGDALLPDDLKSIIFNVTNEAVAQQVSSNLSQIINCWEQIKQYIQYKKANNIVTNGKKVNTTSIKEILTAVAAINTPIPNNKSAQEFEELNGTAIIGAQSSDSLWKKIQRAHELAIKMDKSGNKKVYPNFSEHINDIYLNVLHPNNKRAILLGPLTKCCFTPYGKADEEGKSKYSLLQYCTTTKYGGVFICESSMGEVFMGTPFLVNGNMMMFHSYETANELRAYEVNQLLVKAAVSAIKKSNGTIDVVFMTDLYTGDGRLNVDDKIAIPSYFMPYTDGGLCRYKNMYNNLYRKNCVLAINVNGEILVGKQMIEWYESQCQNNPELLIKKLNLHTGKREFEFNWGKSNVKREIHIYNNRIVQACIAKIEELEKKRDLTALLLQKKKIEAKKTLELSDKIEFKIITQKIKKLKDEENAEYIKMLEFKSIYDLQKKIWEIRDKQLLVYSGQDIDLIAKVNGINIEEEIRKKIEKQISCIDKIKRNDRKQRKIIGKLISQVKTCKDENVRNIKDLIKKIGKRTLTEEETSILKHAGIDIKDYEEILLSSYTKKYELTIDIKKHDRDNIEAIINQKVKKMMKNKSQKEQIIAEILFKDEQNPNNFKLEMEKLKAQITIDIENKKRILAIKKRIDGRNKKNNANREVSHLIYGNSWYIALDSNKKIVATKRKYKLDRKNIEKIFYQKNLVIVGTEKTNLNR